MPNFILPGWVWRFGIPLLFAVTIARLWLMPLPSSFWVDEMGTAFVLHFGAQHWSFTVAPQVPASIYYALPRFTEHLFGFSEVSYRIPSILAMGGTLFFVGRLAARLMHPHAAWFAVFACLSLRGINYEACNARPYALGAYVAVAGLWLLIRWLDASSNVAQWSNAAGFLAAGALLWRVHLVFWPIYVVFAIYAVLRLVRGDTHVSWGRVAAVFVLIGLTLLPILVEATHLLQQAASHVVVALPRIRDLRRAVKLSFVAYCGLGAWLLRWGLRWRPPAISATVTARVLIAAFWLLHPLCLFLFSWITGKSLFLDRYLAVTLPGVALAVTLAAAYFIPVEQWKPVTLLFAAGVVLVMMNWRERWPAHHNSNWRGAARQINLLSNSADTPILCPSPFIEAQPPVWRPDYPLPSFLYSYLPVYPVSGRIYRFPFRDSPQAEDYAISLAHQVLPQNPRFILYGGDANVRTWRKWFAMRPELKLWVSRRLGHFGDVDAVVFESHVDSWLRF